MNKDFRIPRSIRGFNSYIENTANYLLEGNPTNAVRLGFLADETDKWVGFSLKWKPLFPLYSDRKGTYTTSNKDALRKIIFDCRTFNHDNSLLDRIGASPNVKVHDLEVFRIKKGILKKETRTAPKTKINEPVGATLQSIGGGSFSVKCRSSKGGRAAIFEEADSVQYVYLVGDTAPASAEVAGLTKEISTRASFTLELSSDNSEKHLYIYFRWYRTKYPSMSGPWNTLQTMLIV